MAVKDVKNYYKIVEAQYFEMLNDSKDYTEALEKGLLTEEQVTEAFKMIDKVKENYLRLAYILMLLEMPQRESKKSKHKKMHSKLYDNSIVQSNNSEAIIKENADTLKNFKLYVENIKEK